MPTPSAPAVDLGGTAREPVRLQQGRRASVECRTPSLHEPREATVVFRTEHTLGRVLLVYLLGVAASIQVALYLYDFYDDGVADPRSALVGLALLALGLAFAAWRFLHPRRRGTPARR